MRRCLFLQNSTVVLRDHKVVNKLFENASYMYVRDVHARALFVSSLAAGSSDSSESDLNLSFFSRNVKFLSSSRLHTFFKKNNKRHFLSLKKQRVRVFEVLLSGAPASKNERDFFIGCSKESLKMGKNLRRQTSLRSFLVIFFTHE